MGTNHISGTADCLRCCQLRWMVSEALRRVGLSAAAETCWCDVYYRTQSFCTARRYASVVYVFIGCLSVCLSVYLSVCLSQVEALQRWLNL